MPLTRPADPNHRDAIARDALLNALAALGTEQKRLTELTEAQHRAMEQSWSAPHRVQEAEELRRLRETEQSRLAYEFVSGGITEASPVSTAQLQLEAAQAENEQITKIRNALDAEIAQVNLRIQRRQASVHEALADVILDSDAFRQLFAEQTKLFARIRGLRKAFQLIRHACGGHMPQQIADRFSNAVSLDPEINRDALGQPVVTDEKPAQIWGECINQLLVDPDYPLPQDV